MALKVNNRQTENKASLKESVQKVSTRPVKQTNWYKGSKPTSRETLARIYTIGNSEPEKRDQLMSMYQEEVANPTSPIYNPYTSATTNKQTQTNVNNTLKAQDEWARLSDELSYWATRSDRNYSDDEIISRINWDNYKTLQKMNEGRKTGNPLALLDAVGYSEDAMYGVIWAARNPDKSTGDYTMDAVQSVLGRGNQYKANDISAYRDATGSSYSPYKAGATALDDLAYKYGMSGDFTREWLDGEGRSLLNGDAQSREDYTRIYKVVTGTEAVEKEANEFYEKYAKPLIEAGEDPANIFYDGVFEDLEYKNLAKFVEGAKSGDLYETAYAVGFDYDELVGAANEYYAKTKGTLSNNEYEEKLAASTGGTFYANEGTQKSNDAKQLNSNILLPDYASVATEGERSAFRTTASAGFYDVVGSTYDFVTNGKGGEAEYKASAIAEATAYANENLFKALDDLAQAEAAFAEAGEMDADVSEFLKANFPEFAKDGKYPTEQEVLDAFRSGKIQMPEGLLPEEQTVFVENVVHSVAGRGQAVEAQAIIDNVLDDFAEAYGKDTEQYRAAIATYEAAYGYKEPKNTWTAFDNYQYASQQEGVTPEMLGNYLTNQRGEVGRQILQVKALIENAEAMGMPKSYIENMQKHLGDLQTQNELLNAHNLAKNEDYSAKVAEFDAAYEPYKWKLFGANKITESDIIRYAVTDIDSALDLADNKNAGDVLMLAQNMTDEERSNYKYIYMTEGEEAADAYFAALSNNLYVRSSEERSERLQGFAEEHPLAGTAGSFLMVPMESFAAASTIISKITGEDINPYSPTFAATQGKSDLRTGSKEAFHNAVGEDKKVLNWAFDTLYDAMTSAADSGINAAMGGKYGSVLMGLSGFEAGVMDASIRGANDWQAIGYGIASAAIEAITEKAQIDEIFSSFSAGSKACKEALMDVLKKGFFSEAGEEMLSALGGTITDELIMGELSNREAAIEKYMEEAGLTREEAEEQANKDILVDILYSGLVGGLSGAMSSGASYGAGKIFGKGTETAEPAALQSTEAAQKERAVSALNTSMQAGVSEAQQAATVAGVLQSYGLSDIEANAAAKSIVGHTNVRALRSLLSHSNDPVGLIKAIAMGSVAERSKSYSILSGSRIDSKNAETIGSELVAAYNEDIANEAVTTEYDARVAFSAESDAAVEMLAPVDHSALDVAKEKSNEAQRKLDEAEAELDRLHQNVVAADAKFKANPADDSAKAALKSAIEAQRNGQNNVEKAKQEIILAKRNLAKARSDFNATVDANMNTAREQAKAQAMQGVNEIQAKRIATATEKADAMYGYSEYARAEVLAGKSLPVINASESTNTISALDVATLEQSRRKEAVQYVKQLVEKFGVFKKYNNQNVEIEFEFTKSGLKESTNKQEERGGDYVSFSKMLANLDALVTTAVPIETHTDKYVGTKREDQQLERVYVLLSAFRDGKDIVPVQFEVKEFRDKENKLYVAVSLKKTEAADLHAGTSFDATSATTASSNEETGRGADTPIGAKSTTVPSNISIPELIQKINPQDGDFLKYIPDSMLSEEQKQSKEIALEKERAKIEKLRNESVSDAKENKKQPEIKRTQVPPQTARGARNYSANRLVNPVRSTRNLANALNIGERIGTRKMNNMPQEVLGYYNNRARYLAVRSNQAGNITVNMHEIGHAIAQRLGMTGTPQMVANLPAMFTQNYAANELPGEAFAEFVWRYMTDDVQAEAFAGSGFIYQFEQALRREGIADAVHQARNEMHEFVNANVNSMIGSMVVDRSHKERTSVREWFTKIVAGLADSTVALEQIDSDIRNRNEEGLSSDESLVDAALMRNTAEKRAWNILTGNLTDSNWNIVGRSLASAIESSGMEGADFDLLNNYMLALHSIDREAQGLPVFDDSIGFDDRQAFISDVEQNHYNVARAAEEIHKWWHDFMQLFMVDTGYLTQEALDTFERMYPHYVPTNRVKKQGAFRRNGVGSTYEVRRATGSTEEIYNPMDTIVQNVNTIVKMVSQNNVGLVFDNLYNQYEGLGVYARNVTQDMRLDRVNTEGLRDSIEEILTNANTDQDVMEEILDMIGNEQTQFRATGNVNLPNVMQVRMPDSTRRFYEFSDNEIFKAISGLSERNERGLLDWFGRMTRSMSALTTGSNPLFSIRNFMRDFQKSVNYGSWATTYADGMAKWLCSAYEVWHESGEYEQYKALGGGGWTRIDANTKKGADEYRGELFRGYNTSSVGRTAKWAGKKVWNAITLSRLNEIVEQASRYAEYRFGQHDKSTEGGRQEAFLAAQEATIDFSRAGNSQLARDLKQIIPFFNASIQGIYQTGREFASEKERGRLPARFAKTVLNTAIASALASGLMLKFMDEEDKEEFFWLSDDLKSDHIYIPNFLGDDAPLIRIPLSQDPLARAVHGWVTNMMWSKENADEPAIELSAIANNIIDGFNPISGTVWDPVLSMATNKNWYGSNIVPTRMQEWHPTTQYTEETADLFVKAGQKLNVSPLMLEYMAEQYTGFIGQIVIPAISKNEFTGEMQGVSAVVAEARKKLTSDPLLSNNITSVFYDSADMFEQIKSAASNTKEQYWLNRGLTDEEARAAVDEAEAMLKSGGIISDTKKMISDAYNRIDEVNANPDLTDHEKYVQTSAIRREMLENVLDANETIGAYCEKYINGENLFTRAMFTGNVARASTTYEKLPEVFKNDYDGDQIYMKRSYETWESTGKDAALPKVSFSFDYSGTSYEVKENLRSEFTEVYKNAYERNVNTIVGWDILNDEEKLKALKSAHTKANNEAKKWYATKAIGKE